MFSVAKFLLGTLAMISYVLMFVVIIRFFDSMNLVNGAVMFSVWLITLGLLCLADQPAKPRSTPSMPSFR